MSSAHPERLHPVAAGWLTALVIGVAAVYALFFVTFFRQSGPRDGDQFLVFHSLQYWNAALFGIAKQWTPVMCSGLSLAGEPQVPFMSLSMALSYVWGPLLGVRLTTAAYLVAGWFGGFLYAGLWLRIRLQRALAASLFIGNGFFFCRLGFGHFDFIPFLILPLILWVLHRGAERTRDPFGIVSLLRRLFTVLLLGATVALVIDGSPVAIIHLLLWIGIYAGVLAVSIRRTAPAAMFASAVLLAALLDAGYLWPMLQSQTLYPRLTADRFTSALSLLWFAILPLRGKVLPANGNGHELSVYIGPVLIYCLWRYRSRLAADLPAALGRPLLVVSVASIVLGMGSLKGLHVPTWLSPFDLLRPLPGFRSIGVTGRFWGFLALPLSLMSAAALWRFASELRPGWRMHVCFASVLIFQLGFQAETLTSQWLHSPLFLPASLTTPFKQGPETVEYVALPGENFQGQILTPTRGVCDCYDMDDFTRAQNGPGSTLVAQVIINGKPLESTPPFDAHFVTWSHIRIHRSCAAGSDPACALSPGTRVQFTLSQAYHQAWRAAGCITSASARGNLIIDCPAEYSRAASLEVVFDDLSSDRGARISLILWTAWLVAIAFLLVALVALMAFPQGRRRPASRSIAFCGPSHRK
jgi:hypothetical protein